MTYPTERPATWLVTGASRGLGLALVTQLLERGENVVATSRDATRVTAALTDVDTARLQAVTVDLADEAQVSRAVADAVDRFGGLDVVVNNAGYGYLAAVEEVADADARAMFDVQVFGVWNVLRAVLPGFRDRRAGHIINVSSVLGLLSFPGWGLYGAGKFALEALTESLAAEVAEFGIRVNLVEPGYMRTDFLRPVSIGLPETTGDAYPAIREMVRTHLDDIPGTQRGDPSRAAAAIIRVATSEGAPLHQLLGSDSLALAEGRVQALAADIALPGTSPSPATWPRPEPSRDRRGREQKSPDRYHAAGARRMRIPPIRVQSTPCRGGHGPRLRPPRRRSATRLRTGWRPDRPTSWDEGPRTVAPAVTCCTQGGILSPAHLEAP